MDKFVVTGGKPLSGEIMVSGAKNASLALMPAALLAPGISVLYNTPQLNDVKTMIRLLSDMGAQATTDGDTLILNTSGVNKFEAPYELVKKMRASVYVLGPLLGRYNYAKVSLPGGCAWGPRPINLHIEGLKKMGASIELESGDIIASTTRLHGAKIHFDKPSVGATGNLLMAAVLAKGTTVINNAAMEPEIGNLVDYLVAMGAKISGINSSILEIEGVDELSPAGIKTIPDRIEAGTLLIAGAITRGAVSIKNANYLHLYALLSKLEDAGVPVTIEGNTIGVDARKSVIKAVNVSTGEFPGFPTDMQAQWTALMAVAEGASTVTDTIYIDRFAHIQELVRLGADITVKENNAVINGVKQIKGAKVMSTDLRASASLVLAGLAAKGTTEVLRIYHLDRGYQELEKKLIALGAQIERQAGAEF